MKTWQECCDKFKVRSERGLTADQVHDNLAKYGHNGETNPDISKVTNYQCVCVTDRLSA